MAVPAPPFAGVFGLYAVGTLTAAADGQGASAGDRGTAPVAVSFAELDGDIARIGLAVPRPVNVGLEVRVTAPQGAGSANEEAGRARETSPWRFEVMPYLRAASVRMEATVDGVSIEAHESFSDLLPDLDAGFALHAEAWNREFGLLLDGLSMGLGFDATYSKGNVKVETDSNLTLTQFEVAPLWRVVDEPRGDRVRPATADLFAGTRFTRIEFSGSAKGMGPLGLTKGVETSEAWFDPIAGARAGMGLAKWLSFDLRGDVGGFDIGESSKFTFKAPAGVNIEFTSWFALTVAYQVLGIDRANPVNSRELDTDAFLYGPLAGLQFVF